MRSTVAPKPDGDCEVYTINDVAIVEFRGYITGAVVTEAVESLRQRLLKSYAAFIVIDCTHIESFRSDVSTPGVSLLKVARDMGVRSGICISQSAAVRMMGSSVAFVSAVPVKFLATRVEAMDRIRRVRVMMAEDDRRSG